MRLGARQLVARHGAQVNLVGAVEKTQRTTPTPQRSQRGVGRQADGAEDLHGTVQHARLQLRGHQLDGRHIHARGGVALLVHQPGRTQHQQARLLESDTKANILSTPNLVTLDNEEAKIVVGQNLPFVTGSYATTGTATTTSPLPAVAVGQTLKVLAQTKASQAGVAIPAAAVVRNAANESVVWVHESAERFVSRKVKAAALDGHSVAVTDGLTGGERVVVQGAASLAQIR